MANVNTDSLRFTIPFRQQAASLTPLTGEIPERSHPFFHKREIDTTQESNSNGIPVPTNSPLRNGTETGNELHVSCELCSRFNFQCSGWAGWKCDVCWARKAKCNLSDADWLKRVSFKQWVQQGGVWPTKDQREAIKQDKERAKQDKKATEWDKKAEDKKAAHESKSKSSHQTNPTAKTSTKRLKGDFKVMRM